jgi:hypothetical protein
MNIIAIQSVYKMNTTDFFTLETLRTKIEKMPKDRHIQCLNILAKYPSVIINEPKYGNVNINLSCVPKEAVDDLLKFVSYVEDQENSLMLAEKQKKIYQEVFFAWEAESMQMGL